MDGWIDTRYLDGQMIDRYTVPHSLQKNTHNGISGIFKLPTSDHMKDLQASHPVDSNKIAFWIHTNVYHMYRISNYSSYNLISTQNPPH